MTHRSLEIVLAPKCVPAPTVWDRLYESHGAYLDGLGGVEFGGRTYLARDIANAIRRSGKEHFGIQLGAMQALDYAHVANCNLSFVSVLACVRDQEDAEAWLLPFVDGQFRYARFFDGEYEFWQNATDPLEYSARGWSSEGLPKKSNGLPPPLRQMVIDTSRNPGRRSLRKGFIESVGSPMWLGEAFWALAGSSRRTIGGLKWLHCEAWKQGVVRLRPADGPFTTAKGEMGELQDRLREVLYPNSAKRARRQRPSRQRAPAISKRRQESP